MRNLGEENNRSMEVGTSEIEDYTEEFNHNTEHRHTKILNLQRDEFEIKKLQNLPDRCYEKKRRK